MPSSSNNNTNPLGRLLPATARRMFHRAASSIAVNPGGDNAMAVQKDDTEFFASLEQSYNDEDAGAPTGGSSSSGSGSDHNDTMNNSSSINALGLNKLAFFDRSEIKADPLVMARGNFTSLRPVTSILLDTDSRRRTSPRYNQKQQARRQAMQSTLSVVLDGAKDANQHRYAIKQLTTKTLQESNPQAIAKAARDLVNDAKFLARLSRDNNQGSGTGGGGHPNIPKLYAMTMDAFGRNYLAHAWDDFFLVTDNLHQPNDTLANRIYGPWRARGGCDSEPDEDLIPLKANYAFQLAKALRYCHEQGVLFRDLKPPNVGFSWHDKHVAQLLDFSLARDFSEDNGSNNETNDDEGRNLTLAGTRRYLAGEVLATGRYSFKSDVYTWAMTFYEMCSERKPYSGLSAADHQLYVCQQPQQRQGSAPPQVQHEHLSSVEGFLRPSVDDYYLPEELEDILTKAWHPDLAQRSSMDDVCDQMQAFLMHLDIAYYEQNEGEYLFDVSPRSLEDAEVEELRGDEDWECMGGQAEGFQLSPAAIGSIDLEGDGDTVEEDPEMLTSFKSVETAGTKGLGAPEKAHKIISRAA